ncbi:Plasmid stabilization system protein [Burkholderiales bacterium 8X]|nr:Plasmid stabilization system protein [Burkholderiales bacterium 8X]
MQTEFSPLAIADLQEIGDYIAQDNPVRARTFVNELIDQAEIIARMPNGYALREELAPDLRMCRYRRYILFFRVVRSMVRVERVLNSRRDVGSHDFSD